MEIQAAHSSYKTALFYADSAIKSQRYRQGPMDPESSNILRDTQKEMESAATKDYFYTASVRKWYNIAFYEKVKRYHTDKPSFYSLAADALEKAYKMRDVHEQCFLGEASEDDLDAAKRNFANAVVSYESKIPVLE